MPPEVPSRLVVNSIICEGIRTEVAGKLVLYGAYLNGIRFQRGALKEQGFVATNLVFVCGIQGPSGKKTVSWMIANPDDSYLVGPTDAEVNFEGPVTGGGLVLHVPLKIHEFGTYVLRLKIEGEKYEREFEIQEE